MTTFIDAQPLAGYQSEAWDLELVWTQVPDPGSETIWHVEWQPGLVILIWNSDGAGGLRKLILPTVASAKFQRTRSQSADVNQGEITVLGPFGQRGKDGWVRTDGYVRLEREGSTGTDVMYIAAVYW